MRMHKSLFLLVPCSGAMVNAQNLTYLSISALVTNTQNDSAWQCWQFTDKIQTSAEKGIVGASIFDFGAMTNATYTVTPPRFDGGIHNAPRVQLVQLISGGAVISLPHNSSADLYLVGGSSAMLIAADTIGSGHRSVYPTDQSSVLLALPFASGKPPPYKVIGEAPCVRNNPIL